MNKLACYSIYAYIPDIPKGLLTSAGKHLGSPNQKDNFFMLCLKKYFLILCLTGLNLAFNFAVFRQL